jgi:hypothetical protein
MVGRYVRIVDPWVLDRMRDEGLLTNRYAVGLYVYENDPALFDEVVAYHCR